MAMYQKLTLNLNNHSQGKLMVETLIRVEASRSRPISTSSPKGNVESFQGRSFQGRQPRTHFTNGNGGKFPLPKNTKVDIPIFKGDGDILNWLYQLEHVFSIHETLEESRVEFYQFYPQGDALLWWRWLEKQEKG